MTFARCPSCGRFCSDVVATVVGVGEPERIDAVRGICRRHGLVDLSDTPWCWEDFFPEETG